MANMHDSFVTEPEWLQWLNTEIRALDLLCARAGYVLPSATSTVVSTAPYTITVTGELLAVLGVWEVVDTRYRRLALQNPIDFVQQDGTTGLVTGPALKYSATRVAASDSHTIALWPRPTSGTYIALTLPISTLATDLSTSLWYPLGFEEYLVLKLARRALIKENSEVTSVESLLREQMQMIEEACWSRQLGEAPSVRNTDDVNRHWDTYPVWPSADRWAWL